MSDVDPIKVAPGPWIAVGMGSEGYNIYSADYEKPITEQRFRGAIAQVRGGEWQTLKANAHLIAAAPEMLGALHEIMSHVEHMPLTPHVLSVISIYEKVTYKAQGGCSFS